MRRAISGFVVLLAPLIVVLTVSGVAFSQDPGNPDICTVECRNAVPPNSQVILNINLVNDENINGFIVPLSFDSPTNTDITCDSISFVGTREATAFYKSDSTSIDNATKKIIVFAFYLHPYILAPGSGPIAKIYFSTGPNWRGGISIPIDTTLCDPTSCYEFVTETGAPFYPIFEKGCLNSIELIFLINYLFRGGPAPIPLESGDVNCDGQVGITDVIYLINYLFKGGPPLGC